MQYVIKSRSNKKYVKLEKTKGSEAELKWDSREYTTYKSFEDAEITVKIHKLKNVKIIKLAEKRKNGVVLSTKDACPILPTENKVSRYDEHMKFLDQLKDKAKKFKMESVGVKDLDRAVVNPYVYEPRKHVSTRKLLCILPRKLGFHIIEYEISSPGRIVILNYKSTKEFPQAEDRVAVIKEDYNDVVTKITLVEYRGIKKLDRADTLVVDNPHVIINVYDEGNLNKVKPKEIKIVNNASYSSLLVNIDQNWYEIYYHHVRKGVIHVYDYRKVDRVPEPLQKIAFITSNNDLGIHKLTIGLWGARKGYKNIEGFTIETENKEYMIENPHEVL